MLKCARVSVCVGSEADTLGSCFRDSRLGRNRIAMNTQVAQELPPIGISAK